MASTLSGCKEGIKSNTRKRNAVELTDHLKDQKKRHMDSDIKHYKFSQDNPLEIPSYYARSVKLDLKDTSFDLKARKQKLCDLLVDSMHMLDELFHLRNFTSLVYFDPQNVSKIQQSESFKKFEGDYNLWPKTGDQKARLRISSRISEHTDPLKQEIMDKVQMMTKPEMVVGKDYSKIRKHQVKKEFQSKHLGYSRKIKRSCKPKYDKKNKYQKLERSKSNAKDIGLNTSKNGDSISVQGDFGDNDSEEKHMTDDAVVNRDNGYADSSDESSPILIDQLPVTYHYPSKLKLNYNVKPQIITNPVHLIKPKFKNLEKYLDSFIFTTGEPTEEVITKDYEKYLLAEKQKIFNVKIGLQKHILRLDKKENVFRNVPNGSKEPTMIRQNFQHGFNHYKERLPPFRMQNQVTQHDNLLAQGVKSSKLIHKSRIIKVQKGRKITQMIENHFKRLSQEEERKIKEFHRMKIKLAKDTAREVKKKWIIAVKAYKILEEKAEEKERAEQSKKELSKILDQSTKMLGAQLSANRSENNTQRQIIEKDENTEEDSDYFSSSSSGFEESSGNGSLGDSNEEIRASVNNDDKLSPEQLREKYKNLEKVKMPFMSSTDSDAESSEDENYGYDEGIEGNDLRSLYRGNASNFPMRSLHSTHSLNGKNKLLFKQVDLNKPFLDDNRDKPYITTPEDKVHSATVITENSISNEDSKISHGNGDLAPVGENLKSLVTDEIDEDSDEDSLYEEDDLDTPTSSPKNVENNGNDIKAKTVAVADVPIPTLLRGVLRPYQKEGLNWLVSLYNNRTNGILADEMGLGKTIQTIALLAYLACEKNEWGPHLIVVPTSVILNWEMEFKRFAPGFKVLTYYGTPQQRKEKRKGWNTPDTFHVCITSYQLVVQDHTVFRRKKWQYMVLDEAHNIKNFRSQRWRSLLNFNTEHRLLLTGTPLQNNIVELWSLLYFLMPSSQGNNSMPEGFANLIDFQQWFGKPVDKIIQSGGLGDDAETKATVNKLHQVLRPYLLRRLKQDVEKQLPAKYEHIVYCRLSKRQRLLYDDFMSRAQTKETLASGNFLSIINCLMQLRKVCNHPDLFEVRPINTSFALQRSVISQFANTEKAIKQQFRLAPFDTIDLGFMNLLPAHTYKLSSLEVESLQDLSASQTFAEKIDTLKHNLKGKSTGLDFSSMEQYYKWMLYKQEQDLLERTIHLKYINDHNCNRCQYVSADLINSVTLTKSSPGPSIMTDLVKEISTRATELNPIIQNFAFVTPNAICEDLIDLTVPPTLKNKVQYVAQNDLVLNPFHHVQIKETISFPDKSLLQYDCGKLQKLAILLEEIIPNGHRVLIFTQMSKMLDVLEKFLNYNGYTYLRLDGATKIEDRQLMTERFNRNDRIKCFILSTRSGGLGINLTGADTVVFYDSDWNPAMDKQCQDRCHRIGQTRDVHIYRFVSEYTIESNILKKANQKRQLDNVVIQEGDFTTDYFSKITINDLLGKDNASNNSSDLSDDGMNRNELIFNSNTSNNLSKALEQAEDVEDANAAKVALNEINVDANDFTDQQNCYRSPSVGILQSHQMGESEDSATELFTKRIDKFTVQHSKHGHEIESNKITGRKEADEDDEVDDDDDDDDDDGGVGHIDEYMIRFIAGGFYF